MTRLEAFAYGVMTAEGFFPGSRSWRNNNPGNLRSSPYSATTEDNFAVFGSFAGGWRALCLDLWLKCSGRSKSGLTPASTLEEFVLVYAHPANDEETRNYIQTIVGKTGCPAEATLSWVVSA